MDTTAVIAGIDEAGRGPLAGPVVAGACVIPLPLFKRRRAFNAWSPFRRKRADDCVIADSKCLTPESRERAFAWITMNCMFGFGIVPPEEIDRLGILRATERAMHLAIRELEKSVTPTSLLIDGRDAFSFPYPHLSIIGGDGLEPSIAAASIVAKVTRDRLMCDLAKEFPSYGFSSHKGYASVDHVKALRTHGPCGIHRQSYLKKMRERLELPAVLAGE